MLDNKISVAIINGSELEGKIPYEIDYYKTIKCYSGYHKIIIILSDIMEDLIKIRIKFENLDDDIYGCLFAIHPIELVYFISGIISILFEPVLIGMDYEDIRSVMREASSGTYAYIKSIIHKETDVIANEILYKYNERSRFSDCNRFLLSMRGDVSLIFANEIANIIEDKLTNKNEISVFNAIGNESMGDIIELHLYGIKQ